MNEKWTPADIDAADEPPGYIIEMDEADEAAENALTAADHAYVAAQLGGVSRETQVLVVWGTPEACEKALKAATKADSGAVGAIASPPARQHGQSWRQAIRMLVRKLSMERKLKAQAAFLAKQAQDAA